MNLFEFVLVNTFRPNESTFVIHITEIIFNLVGKIHFYLISFLSPSNRNEMFSIALFCMLWSWWQRDKMLIAYLLSGWCDYIEHIAVAKMLLILIYCAISMILNVSFNFANKILKANNAKRKRIEKLTWKMLSKIQF